MELGSYFLFLQEQRKDIIIILNRAAGNWSNFERVSTYSLEHCISDCFRQRCHPLHSIVGPFECHSRSACTVWVVHCLHSGCNCRAFSAWESARSLPKLSGSSQCALTLTMNVRAPRTLSHTHSTIVVMMSAFASPVSVVRGLLPIHHDTHDTFWSAVSLSLWKIPFVFLRSIPHRSSLNTDISLGKRLLFLVFRVKRTGAWRKGGIRGCFPHELHREARKPTRHSLVLLRCRQDSWWQCRLVHEEPSDCFSGWHRGHCGGISYGRGAKPCSSLRAVPLLASKSGAFFLRIVFGRCISVHFGSALKKGWSVNDWHLQVCPI